MKRFLGGYLFGLYITLGLYYWTNNVPMAFMLISTGILIGFSAWGLLP
jgi:hypothetical protein